MKNKHLFSTCLAFFFLSGLYTISFMPSAFAGLLTIGNYRLVGSLVRQTLYEYDYTYTADITNTGAAVVDVIATLTSNSPYTKVIDGSLTFGEIPASTAKTSTDTFTIRQDRRYPFDAAAFVWEISYLPGNSAPVANAGPDQTVTTGALVHLDGSASSDVDGNPLTFAWSILSVPAGSTAVLSNPVVVNPTFVADKYGSYTIQLIVNDGTVNSAPDTVSTGNGRHFRD